MWWLKWWRERPKDHPNDPPSGRPRPAQSPAGALPRYKGPATMLIRKAANGYVVENHTKTVPLAKDLNIIANNFDELVGVLRTAMGEG